MRIRIQRRTSPLILFAIMTILVVGSIAPQARPQQQSSPVVRQKAFDVVWKTINEKYFDPKLGGIDWSAVRTWYSPQVSMVKTDQELYALLDRMLQELRISHARTYDLTTLEKLMALAEVNTGLVLRDVGGGVVVTRVLSHPTAYSAGLRAGIVVNEI